LILRNRAGKEKMALAETRKRIEKARTIIFFKTCKKIGEKLRGYTDKIPGINQGNSVVRNRKRVERKFF